MKKYFFTVIAIVFINILMNAQDWTLLLNSNIESYKSSESFESKNKLIVNYDIIISNITNILDEQVKIIEQSDVATATTITCSDGSC